jgi:hypothetical protein
VTPWRLLIVVAAFPLLADCSATEFLSGASGTAGGETGDETGDATNTGSMTTGGCPGAECDCADLEADPQNCGACGVECEQGQACGQGNCTNACEETEQCAEFTQLCVDGACLCKPGLSRCGDACVDLQSNPAHCGECGADCGEEACGAGACQPSDCPTSVPDLCGQSCVDLETDPNHCSECDDACAGDELCIGGDCREYELTRCDACPCGECERDADQCCDLDPEGGIVCIEADRCP